MPTQATNTTSGNWRARYASEFYDQRGRHWRVELIDNQITGSSGFGFSQSTVLDVDLTGDGFDLTWDGPTDHVGASIIPSSCTVTWVLTTNQMENLKTVVKDSNDDRLGIALYYDNGGSEWHPYWVGILNHEAIEYETQDLPYMITMTANCGLNRLSQIPFRDSSNQVYTDDVSIAEVFARCINKIPTANFWNSSEPQMREVVDLYSHDHFPFSYTSFASSQGDEFPNSVIERTVVSSLTFSEDGKVKEDDFGRRIKQPPNFNSCRDVLENISNAFGARITQARFSFWWFPANALNWSHSLRVQKWTRFQVASETIQTTLVVGANADTSSFDTVNFRHDADATHALGNGWMNSYLLPVKRCTLTFRNAGTRSLLGNPKNFYLDYPSPDPTFINQDIVLSAGDNIHLSGVYSCDQLVKEYGLATGEAFDEHGTDRIGARIILRFKIMVNTQIDPTTGNPAGTVYYYKSEYNVETSASTDIDMPFGFDFPATDPDLPFNRVFLDDAEWTTTEGFYDVIIPWDHSTPPASIEQDGGWERRGGLHIEAQQNGEFKYRINSTQWDDVTQSIDFTCLGLPDALSSYNGFKVTVDRVVVTRNGTLKQTYPELDNILTSGFVGQDYNFDGSDNTSNDSSIPKDRLDDFVVRLGSNSDDADWDVFVEQTENSEFLDCGETTIGSNQISGEPQSDGALKIIEIGSSISTPQVQQSPDWYSITDEITQLEESEDLHIAMLREQLYQRGKALHTQNGQLVPQVKTTAEYNAPIDILNVIHHNCSTTGDVEDYLVPFRLSHIGRRCTYDVDTWLIDRERLSFESDENKVSKGDGAGVTGGSGGGGQPPNGFSPTYAIGGTSAGQPNVIRAENLRNVITDATTLKDFAGDALKTPPSSGLRLVTVDSNAKLAFVADGTNKQLIQTDGAGTLSFVDPPSDSPYLYETRTLTRSAINALSGSSQTIISAQTDKFIVIEETYFMLSRDRTGSYSDCGGNIEIRQATVTNANQTISVFPQAKINQITNRHFSSETNAMYFRDVPTGGDSARIYSLAKDTVLFVGSSCTLPTNVDEITVKIKYRVLDKTTF